MWNTDSTDGNGDSLRENLRNPCSFIIFAAMKRMLSLGLLLLSLLAACTPKGDDGLVETRHGTSLPTMVSPELAAVDSLLWQQPDSALTCLLPYFDTCKDTQFSVSTATAYDRHYANR